MYVYITKGDNNMRFNRKAETKENSRLPLENTLDFVTCYKIYVQSYLRWLYEQNPDFSVYLTTEEITNYLLQEIVHPIWFEVMLHREGLRMMADITFYLNKYKSHAHQMSYRIPIVTRQNNPNLYPVECQSEWTSLDKTEENLYKTMYREEGYTQPILPMTELDEFVMHCL